MQIGNDDVLHILTEYRNSFHDKNNPCSFSSLTKIKLPSQIRQFGG